MAPDGTQATLVDHRGAPGGLFSENEPGATTRPRRSGGATCPFTGTSGPTATSAPSSGPPPAATWKLVVAADSAADIGRLSSWTLRIATADCAPRARLSVSPTPIAPGAERDAGRVAVGEHGAARDHALRVGLDDGSHVFTDGTAVRRRTPSRGRRTTRSSVRVSDANGVIGTASSDLIVSLATGRRHQPRGGAGQGADLHSLDGSASTTPTAERSSATSGTPTATTTSTTTPALSRVYFATAGQPQRSSCASPTTTARPARRTTT